MRRAARTPSGASDPLELVEVVEVVELGQDVGHRRPPVVGRRQPFGDPVEPTVAGADVDDRVAQRRTAGVEHEDQTSVIRPGHGCTLHPGTSEVVAQPERADDETSEPVETDESVEEVAERIADHNEDEITRREAFEQELQAQGRSDEGAEVGDEID